MARRSAEQWASLVERWKESGLGASAFARREGVDAGQLSWWKWRLKSRPASASSAPAALLPVRVVAPGSVVRMAMAIAPPVEIALPSGAVVRIASDVDDETLTRVLRAVEAVCC